MSMNPVTSAAHAMRELADESEAGSASAGPSSATGVDQNQFLTLLVAQLKNQDPMNPTDSAQFMGELAQFSTLQEVIGMHQDLNTLLSASGLTTQQA